MEDIKQYEKIDLIEKIKFYYKRDLKIGISILFFSFIIIVVFIRNIFENFKDFNINTILIIFVPFLFFILGCSILCKAIKIKLSLINENLQFYIGLWNYSDCMNKKILEIPDNSDIQHNFYFDLNFKNNCKRKFKPGFRTVFKDKNRTKIVSIFINDNYNNDFNYNQPIQAEIFNRDLQKWIYKIDKGKIVVCRVKISNNIDNASSDFYLFNIY